MVNTISPAQAVKFLKEVRSEVEHEISSGDAQYIDEVATLVVALEEENVKLIKANDRFKRKIKRLESK